MRWCSGCSRSVAAPCSDYMCPLNREDRAKRVADSLARKNRKTLMAIGVAAFASGVIFGICVSTVRQAGHRPVHCERLADSMPLFGDCMSR